MALKDRFASIMDPPEAKHWVARAALRRVFYVEVCLDAWTIATLRKDELSPAELVELDAAEKKLAQEVKTLGGKVRFGLLTYTVDDDGRLVRSVRKWDDP